MASRHTGLKMEARHGYSAVFLRGRPIGFVHPHGAGHQASTLGRKVVGGHHRTPRAAAEHLARRAARPKTPVKRPSAIKNVFKIRKHPTESLGVHPIKRKV